MLQTRLAHSKIGIIIMNQQGVISSANAAFANLVGYKENKIIDTNISHFFPTEKDSGDNVGTSKDPSKNIPIMDKINGENPVIYANITTKSKVKIPVEIVAIKLTGEDGDFFVCTIKSTLLNDIEKEINKLIQKITVFAMQCNSETQIAPFLCSALVKILDLESAWVGVKKTNSDLVITGTFGAVPSSISQGRAIRWSDINQEMPNISFCLQHSQTSVRSVDKDSPDEGAQIISIPLLFCKEPVGIIEIQTKQAPLSPEIMDGLEFAAERFALILKMATDKEHIDLLVTAISSAANGVFITDIEGNIIWSNKALLDMCGYPWQELKNQNIHILKSGKLPKDFFKDFWKTIKSGKRWSGEVINRDKFGALYTVGQTVSPMTDGNGKISHFVVIHDDLTAKKEAEGLINQIQNYDPLTLIPNRHLFEKMLKEKIELIKDTDSKIAVFFIDISNFNIINDTMGHTAGDKILREIADNLSYMTSSGDILARFSGDNFALATEIKDTEEISAFAEKIIKSIGEPKDLDGHEINLGSYIGVTVYPDDTTDETKLMNYADMAMHRAAIVGANSFYFFSHKINEETENRMNLERDLRKALTNHEFILNYQPQIDLKTNTISGWEALIRWHHPLLGLVPPVNFIPIAEDSGLILPIGEWVLTEALRQWRRWREMGLPNAIMAVNLSAVQFRQADLAEFVEKSLIETGVTPENLELELTESVVMQNAEMANEALKKISDIGVRIAIDDFGTGYSSLSYLRRFPVDKLKIDRSFIIDLEKDPDNARITNAIIQLGHILGLEVIAEGVETKGQLKTLKDNGCDSIQGYLFGKPMNPEESSKYVREKLYIPK